MKPILNEQLIDKYILDEFGEIINPPTKDEMKGLIHNDSLTLEKVKLWTLFGGDLMIKGCTGKTILHSASYMGQLDIVDCVLNKGVNVDSLNNNKTTPLLLASWNGHINVIDMLLDRRANINHQDDCGQTAMHIACLWNKLNSIKSLTKINNINYYLKDNRDRTCLDIAKFLKYQQIVDYLTPFYNTK